MAGQPVPVVISGTTIGNYDEGSSYTVQNDGLSIAGVKVWTYSGSKIFDGFAINDHTQDVTYAVGDTGVLHSENLYNLWPIDHEQAPVEPSDLSISYKGSEIASLSSSGTKILKTAGKYMEDDVEVVYTRPSGGGAGWETAPESWATGLIDRTLSGSVYGSMVLTIAPYAFAYCSALTSVSFPKCTIIQQGAFCCCYSLTSASFPECTIIQSSAFASCSALTSVSFSKCTIIQTSAFHSCTALTSASFPECTIIQSSAFDYCIALRSISFPVCTVISECAFKSCTALRFVSFPACTIIQSSAFSFCIVLASASFPKCTAIQQGAFYCCYSLTSVSFPECTVIAYGAFQACYSLSAVSFPACTTIYGNAFINCSALHSISFPACIAIGMSAFNSCRALASASFPACTFIGSYAFNSCSTLSAIYFLASLRATLSESNAFQYTPMQASTYIGVFGSIYVPSSLVASYKAATNWTYYSARIVGV